MGIKRVVDVEFWNDDKVVDMFSPEDKLFMLYLLTNPHTTQLGIYPINKKNMAFELGYSPEAVTVLLDRFQNNYQIIRYSESTREIAIKNYLRHSIIKGGKPVEDLLLKEIAAVKNKDLVQWAFKNINAYENLNDTVKKIVSLFSNDNDIHNDNDNDNENDVSYHDSSPDSSTNRKKPTRHKYGQYKNVLLSDEDMEKLKAEFPADWEQRIERLSEYIESKGAKYKNHLATIRAWARKEKKPDAKHVSSNAGTNGTLERGIGWNRVL
jgi:hypothetical protein